MNPNVEIYIYFSVHPVTGLRQRVFPWHYMSILIEDKTHLRREIRGKFFPIKFMIMDHRPIIYKHSNYFPRYHIKVSLCLILT
jgi:hypothetical protein